MVLYGAIWYYIFVVEIKIDEIFMSINLVSEFITEITQRSLLKSQQVFILTL